MNGEILKRMVRSFKAGDSQAFEKAVQQLILSERKQGHNRVARELEKILATETEAWNDNGGVMRSTTAAPRAKVDGASLVDVRRPGRSLNDIVLDPECGQRLSRFLEEFAKRQILAEYGLQPKRKLLLFGPPGNGKTLCAEVIASELGLPLFYVRFDALVASYLGETAANLRRVFDFASAGLGVLFFDEVDAIGKSRDDRGEVGELKRVVNSFLQLLDGYEGSGPVLAATNYEEALDYALWRRFDDLLFFPRATQEQLVQYLSHRFSGFKVEGFTFAEAADWCEGMSFSDVARIATEAIKTMVLRRSKAVLGQMVREAADQHRAATTHRSTSWRGTEGGG